MAKILAFVKLFDKRDHAEAFVNGTLCMNTIRSFKEYKDESGELRGDKYEGIQALYQTNQLVNIKFDDLKIQSSDLTSPIIIYDNNLLNQNVFCIYSLNTRGHDTVSAETLSDFRRTLALHESCFELGKYCVVVLNASEFIKRCKTAIESNGLHGNLGLVDYFDEHEFHGNMPQDKLGYQKRSLFKEQREYRVKIETNKKVPSRYFLNIGDLADIAVITTPKEFNDKLEIELPDNG